MKLSLAYEMQRPMLDDHAVIDETIEQCVLADQMGFDYVWFVEHHFLTGFSMSPCPEVIFGALSKLTKRIRLGFGVVILPYHHPIRVAERVAMVDHLSNGRVDFGTGRSAPYEQTGMGVDPRDTREMWEESLTMVPKIWQKGLFSWDGKFWHVPPREVLPKPFQQPHPPIWVAAMQASTYQLAAEKGIGVMALGVSAPSVLAPHVKAYHENVRHATPVGAFINDQWLSATVAYCDQDNKAGRELAAKSLKTFFGPDRPYLKDQVNVYERLIEQWGGVPDHLQANFARYIKQDDLSTGDAPEVDLSGGSGAIAQAIWNQLDADTLAERGVIVAGDPESCLKAIKIHEAIGVDQLQFLMATETVPHEKVMASIELFGKYVIPQLREASSART
ncbi:MAG TPA: LLM class flavin-dependent oxidoreductase [Candidatus Tectomicrobia bacterium]|nr:LLM class flavin-dependent oxidoreductase [Candidatus Tectomicrobia bacterium]